MTTDPVPIPCLLCDSATTDGGIIHHPSPAKVAGVPIDLGIVSYVLRRCPSCSFAFKYPRIAEEKLLACYRDAPSVQWGETVNPAERAYDLLARLIDKHRTGPRLLDVGCFTGTFLEYLGDNWERFGVEPATDAAIFAERRQVRVLGPTIESLGNVEPFDTILSIDVLEHLAHPLTHLHAIARILKPGGAFVAVTGDTSTWPWRMLGSRHWYAALPEHVSFYNPECLSKALRPLNLDLADRLVFRHTRMSTLKIVNQTIKNVAYAAGVAVHRVLPNPITNIAFRRSAPPWLTAPDHMALVFRKRSEA